MMKRFLTIMLCAAIVPFVMASCEKSVELDYLTKHPDNTDGPKDGKTPQALLFYFVGTSLDNYFGDNVNALKRAVSRSLPGDGRIVYFRRKSGREWVIREVYYDDATGTAAEKELKSYPDADLNDMHRYLSDMIELVPAERYGIVFGGHGSGWLPTSLGNSWTSKYSAGSQSAYIAPFGELPREDAVPTRFFGESAAMFDIEDIAAEMIATGARFDYVIFDDCFMSNIESLYAMRRATDYIIASPCEIMGAGFPYELVLPRLFTNGGYDRDLEGVCRAFYDFYVIYIYPSGCVALTVCAELEELAVRYANLSSGLTNNVDVSQLQYYEGLSRHLFYDFGQYAELVSANPVLLNDFKEQFDRTFPESCRLHTPSFYTAFGGSPKDSFVTVDYYSGVTISEPADRNAELNRETEWYRATH